MQGPVHCNRSRILHPNGAQFAEGSSGSKAAIRTLLPRSQIPVPHLSAMLVICCGMALMGWSGRAPPFPAAYAGGQENQEQGVPPMTRPTTAVVATLGIDIGKNVFHLIGLNERGAITLRQRLSRRQLETRLTTMPPC